MDYNLSFKQITIGYVDLTQEIVIQELPISMQENTISTSGIGSSKGVGIGSIQVPNYKSDFNDLANPTNKVKYNTKLSVAENVRRGWRPW